MKPRKKPLHPYLVELGAELRVIRIERGLSLEVLGTEIGLDASNLQKIELGQNLTINTLLKLCICLGVSPAEFFDRLPWKLDEDDIDALTTPRPTKAKPTPTRKRKLNK